MIKTGNRYMGMAVLTFAVSATSVAADCLQLDDRGSLVAGRWADFIVFDENPLQNIQATRSLESVYIAGERVSEN